MERSDFSSQGSNPQQGNSPGASSSFGETETPRQGDGTSASSGGMGERARDLAGVARDKLGDVGSNARERASHLRDSLADTLEANAERLRQRGAAGGGQLSAATGAGGVAVERDGRMGEVATKVAGGMDATAGWLREADFEGLKAGIETQVKEHPGRTLLIAVGLGYLIGKALRK